MDCPVCNHNTRVRLVRMGAYEPAWGCTSCGTARKYEFKCSNQFCAKLFTLYFKEKPFETERTKLCEDCLKRYYERSAPSKLREIPDWRLNVDDSSPEQVLAASSSEFGMPTMTHQEWKTYYANTPYEQEKMKSFKQQQEREAKETLSSRDLAITKDTNE